MKSNQSEYVSDQEESPSEYVSDQEESPKDIKQGKIQREYHHDLASKDSTNKIEQVQSDAYVQGLLARIRSLENEKNL